MEDKGQIEIRINAQAILDPNKWIQTANDLMFSADNLVPSLEAFWASKGKARNTHKTYLMLLGYAIENLIKAVFASKLTHEKKEEVKRTGRLPKDFKGHCSTKLIEKSLDIKLSNNKMFSPGTDKLINRIGEAVIWSGRYPSKVYPSGIMFSPNDGQSVSYLLYTDIRLAMDTAKKIKKIVYKKIRPWT